MRNRFGCFRYIHHRGAFGVARFDRQGNAKALTREAGTEPAPRFFVYVLSLKSDRTRCSGSQATQNYYTYERNECV